MSQLECIFTIKVSTNSEAVGYWKFIITISCITAWVVQFGPVSHCNLVMLGIVTRSHRPILSLWSHGVSGCIMGIAVRYYQRDTPPLVIASNRVVE